MTLVLLGSIVTMTDFKPKESKDHKGWYEIPGYSKHLANRKGEIFTKKTENFTKGGRAGRYLKVSVYADGDDNASLCYAHDLVCRAFHGSPKKGQVVLHKDNNRFNNKAGNLSWGSQSENIKQVYDDGLRPSKESRSPWIHW